MSQYGSKIINFSNCFVDFYGLLAKNEYVVGWTNKGVMFGSSNTAG